MHVLNPKITGGRTLDTRTAATGHAGPDVPRNVTRAGAQKRRRDNTRAARATRRSANNTLRSNRRDELA